MNLTALVVAQLSRACAPQVASATLLSLAQAESGRDPLVIGVNTPIRRVLHPADPATALRLARRLDHGGADFDLGLTQLNVRTLRRIGIPLSAALDPCRNLAVGGRLLTENFLAARRRTATSRTALEAALSTYNTGDPSRGLRNGYVARVYRAAAQILPAIAPNELVARPSPGAGEPVRIPTGRAPSASGGAKLDVFASSSSPALVWPTRAGPPAPTTTPPTVTPGDPS